jgi:predicted  nucleic acid-binding Zn-ribbon protein
MEMRLEKLEKRVEELETQVVEIEKNAAVNKEQVKMIFNILNEIKASIKQIADKMDEKSQKPTQMLWSIAGAVVTALIIAGLKFIN